MPKPKPTFLIDTREQWPYRFFDDAGNLLPMRRVKLDEGDYTVEGLEGRVVVERKELNDFVGSISRGRKRFWRELNRLAFYDHAIVVIEGDLSQIAHHKYKAPRVYPSQLIGTIIRLYLKGVPVVMASNRAVAQKFTQRFLEKAWEDYQREGK